MTQGAAVGLVDCVVHLDMFAEEERAGVLDRARAAGVAALIHAGVDPRTATSAAGPGACRVGRAWGIHPQAIEADALEDQLRCLDARLDEPGVVAVGEIGLDRRRGMPAMAHQEVALEQQLQRAETRGLPVILHCVHAVGRLLELLRDRGPLRAGGVFHGFGGPAEMVDELAALGFSFSFGALITRPAAHKCRRAARAVPIDRLLVETDSPSHGEPRDLVSIVQCVAAVRDEPWSDIASATARNAKRLFRFDPPLHAPIEP